MDDIAAIHGLDQSDLLQSVKLLCGDVEHEFRRVRVHEAVREVVAAVGKHDDEGADGRWHGATQPAYLPVEIEAIGQLHVTAPCHQSSPLVIPLYAIQMASCRGVVQGRSV